MFSLKPFFASCDALTRIELKQSEIGSRLKQFKVKSFPLRNSLQIKHTITESSRLSENYSISQAASAVIGKVSAPSRKFHLLLSDQVRFRTNYKGNVTYPTHVLIYKPMKLICLRIQKICLFFVHLHGNYYQISVQNLKK